MLKKHNPLNYRLHLFYIKINFEKLENFNVLPLWHFDKDTENIDNTIRIAKNLNNSQAYLNRSNAHFRW